MEVQKYFSQKNSDHVIVYDHNKRPKYLHSKKQNIFNYHVRTMYRIDMKYSLNNILYLFNIARYIGYAYYGHRQCCVGRPLMLCVCVAPLRMFGCMKYYSIEPIELKSLVTF